MSENRKCVNCRHNIRKENPSGNIECVCEITNSHIGYVKCFEGWCRHWAKDNKLFVCPDQNEELEVKVTDFENTEVAKSFEQELRKHNGYKHWFKRGKLFIHGEYEPKRVCENGKTTVDIEAVKKHLEDMVRKAEN